MKFLPLVSFLQPRFVLALCAAVFLSNGIHAQGQERFEITALKAVRPSLVEMNAALQKGDLGEAKSALDAFESGRRGVQIYLATRDPGSLQNESTIIARMLQKFKADKPSAPSLAADGKTLLVVYDLEVAKAEKSPPLDPLFDEIARLRIARAPLADVVFAIQAENFVKAGASLTAFYGKTDTVKPILKDRSPAALDAIARDVPQLQAEFRAQKPNAAKSMALVQDILKPYNMALAQVTKEARLRNLPADGKQR